MIHQLKGQRIVIENKLQVYTRKLTQFAYTTTHPWERSTSLHICEQYCGLDYKAFRDKVHAPLSSMKAEVCHTLIPYLVCIPFPFFPSLLAVIFTLNVSISDQESQPELSHDNRLYSRRNCTNQLSIKVKQIIRVIKGKIIKKQATS